ncbi:uncharacterized protein LOC133313586 [Gastrolobium bilobum]|uniref:uncharacterized protein LOC133313586 n=1 Tax=Gastrolobium bilobum TaxID=150636 RepID=UPI002AB0F7E2|nr:uncharacterized protein LOC133313586 [Gastrolobium bilobum]
MQIQRPANKRALDAEEDDHLERKRRALAGDRKEIGDEEGLLSPPLDEAFDFTTQSDPVELSQFFEAMEDDGSDFENDILDDEATDAVCNALTIESLDEEDMEEFMEPITCDKLESIGPSDNEDHECYDNYADFTSENALEGNIELSVGMKFANVDEFREALKEWSISRGVEYKCKKSDRTRVRAICKVSKDCKFLVHASSVGGENTFQIKSWNPDHTCPREAKNNLITSDYLGKKLLEDFRANPKESILGMQNRVNKILGYDIGLQRLYRARRKAMKIIYRDHAHQFEVSRAYGEAIIKTNPGSLVRLSTEPQPHVMVDGIFKEFPPRFQRMYVSSNF